MVKRYDFYSSRNYVSFAHRDEDENGGYVAYEDYAHLEALITDAPHDQECASLRWFSDDFGDCDCWRSRALDTGAKG
jgi:hypothetical protein